MKSRRILLLLVAFAAVAAYQYLREPTDGVVESRPAASAVDEAFRSRQSGVMVRTAGSVDRVLADDLDGSRHQRFILELPSGLTVLVAHNIDVAPRIPDLAVGSTLTVRGQYEWNSQGGVIHWTHHDPDGEHEAGWIEWKGQRYE